MRLQVRCCLLILLSAIVLAWRLQAAASQPRSVGETGIDTHQLFSFNMGADIGEPGEKIIDATLKGEFGRGTGSYSDLSSYLSFEYTALKNLQLLLSIQGSADRIEGVKGMEDRRAVAFGGLSFGLGYQLLDRAEQGTAVTVYAEPFWNRLDEETRSPTQGFGADFTLAVDKELVPGEVVGVFNLLYQPESGRSSLDNSWSRQTTAGFSSGVAVKLNSNLFIALEAQYVRKYNSLDLRQYSGEAFFLGPSLCLDISEHSSFSAGWNVQIIGRSAEEGGTLNTADFSHHMVVLGWSLEF